MSWQGALISLNRKLSHFSVLGKAETAALAAGLGRPHVFGPRTELNMRSLRGNRAFVIEEGWAYTYKILPDGGRQVVDIAIAGDIVGMRSLLLRQTDCSAAMITSGVVYEFERSALEGLFATAPKLAAALLWSSSLDEALVVEHLVDIGRRNAAERLAHFILELKNRLVLVGLSDGHSFRCPLSQSLMADALGLTPIHLNRTVRHLRLMDALLIKDGIVTILDEEKLADLSGYDGNYLDGLVKDEVARQNGVASLQGPLARSGNRASGTLIEQTKTAG